MGRPYLHKKSYLRRSCNFSFHNYFQSINGLIFAAKFRVCLFMTEIIERLNQELTCVIWHDPYVALDKKLQF